MRAWLLDETGGPDSFRLGEVEEPEPGPQDVRIELRVSALNHLDLWVSLGLPAPKSFPHIAGGDGSGIIDAVGSQVEGLRLGDEVIVNPSIGCGECDACQTGNTPFCDSYRVLGEHHPGTLASLVAVPARNAVPKPGSLAWETAGAYGLAYGTAHRMLRKSRLAEGHSLLVVGVGGGVAAAALVLGRAMGARVFVTSRHEAKLQQALDLGAEAGFSSDGQFSGDVKDATGGGVDVVVDNVGPDTFDQSLRSLRKGGRLIVSGGTSGTDVSLKIPYLFFKQVEIIGSTMFDEDEFEEVTALVASGGVPVVIDSVYPFEALPDALERMRRGEQFGKLVLRH